MPDRDSSAGSSVPSRYDLLLVLVPLPLAAAVGAAWLSSATTARAVAVGGLASALVVSYGLFYRTPVGDDEE